MNLKVMIVEDDTGERGYWVNEAWALERLPELAAQLDRLVNREGTPEKEMGMRAVRMPSNRDHRGGVMMLLYPPVELRDATLEQVTRALAQRAHSIISGMARVIHQSYTSDSVDNVALRNLQTELNRTLDGGQGHDGR
jgi:hypothetical protein